jgi:hypothetical protein
VIGMSPIRKTTGYMPGWLSFERDWNGKAKDKMGQAVAQLCGGLRRAGRVVDLF